MSEDKSAPKFVKASEPTKPQPSSKVNEELERFRFVSVLAQLEPVACFRGEAEPLFEVIGPIIDGKALP
jgi:hypothetical protein